MTGDLILASSSPRRSELLAALGLRFRTRSADIDETPLPDEPVRDLVLRLATSKAMAIPADVADVVIGADTEVVLDGQSLGKPQDEGDALRMLAALSGRPHEVMTGVAVRYRGRVETASSVTVVRFRDIDPDEARRYWQTGEPRDKAGAYAIQGLGGVFVEAISGSYSGVVGLPVFETAGLLRRCGLDVLAGIPESPQGDG